jgi:hypothetical protein
MDDNNILNKIKSILGLKETEKEAPEELIVKKINIKLEQLTLDNGTVVEAEVFEADAEVFIVTDDARVPLPIGDYKIQDGRILSVKEVGIISEIKEEATEEPAEEVENKEVAKVVEAKDETPAKKIIESVSKEVHFSKEEVMFEIEKLRTELTEKITALSQEEKEEKVEPLKHAPDNIEKKQLNLYSENRTMSTEDLVFKTMFN